MIHQFAKTCVCSLPAALLMIQNTCPTVVHYHVVYQILIGISQGGPIADFYFELCKHVQGNALKMIYKLSSHSLQPCTKLVINNCNKLLLTLVTLSK